MRPAICFILMVRTYFGQTRSFLHISGLYRFQSLINEGVGTGTQKTVRHKPEALLRCPRMDPVRLRQGIFALGRGHKAFINTP